MNTTSNKCNITTITFQVEVITKEQWDEAKHNGVSGYSLTKSLATYSITGHDTYVLNGQIYFTRFGKDGPEYMKTFER